MQKRKSYQIHISI